MLVMSDSPPVYAYQEPVPDRVFSRPAILKAREYGQILIEPFVDRCVKGSSVDVCLGDWYYAESNPNFLQSIRFASEVEASATLVGLRRRHGIFPESIKQYVTAPMLNPFDHKSVAAMWGQPRRAQPLEYSLPGIPDGTPVIVIPPGGAFLGHTHEFIGSLHEEVTFMVKARSSVGRNRIRICACAGWGDQGYASRITLELCNDSQYRHVILVPGRRIGQVVFIPTTPLPTEELYFKSGKYQAQSPIGKSFDELLKDWSPEAMLPKQHLDFEVLDPLP